jgi:hypothetical protein
MSYDIYLRDPVAKEPLHIDERHHMRGGAKRPLCQLLAMAQMRPDGVWGGD